MARSDLSALVAEAARPLPDPDDPGFARAFDAFGDRKVVLLGEASHGTSEFYRARAAITRRLVEQHGFNIVAVEADWPDAAAVDRYVRHREGPGPDQRPFERFPTWMWRNTDVAAFVETLRAWNAARAPAARCGFYGLDLYNLHGSIALVLDYLEDVDPQAAAEARERYGCIAPWSRQPADYGAAVVSELYEKCEAAVVEQCRELLSRRLDYARLDDGDAFLDAAQAARLVAAAERYYRVMYYGGADSWNLRDTHMFETLVHLLEARGPEAKAVVWAHNSHIGDARRTDMGVMRDELNIGQLCRERFGAQAALIGFGTNSGTVAAADNWDGDMRVKTVVPSRPDSWERACHDAGARGPGERFMLNFVDGAADLRDEAVELRLERFIGVIYRPQTELASHYALADLPRQFDAFVWFDETEAVTPLSYEHAPRGPVPDTYPFGV
ncbi:erythromycin esterase family protein [Caulobacter sp. 17J80-11]|uniref:erythromycin esterase family protein n=1 Tax=Caulobacter sp. 17J80-11 TaxID=2763502 RepID=UPI0016537D6F|nr:erythromycin esterase family protein [Caulobacter sp. 17J80-11]MBC6981419.1 erythromycin esterase family protein [Caulobacter sp. 17J80-11]